MPFTLSHIAAVLPVRKPLARRRMFAAAVVGSMVPDFGLFDPHHLSRVQTHSLMALLHFCLPMGLLVYWLLLLLVRPAMMAVMPDQPYVRLHQFDERVSLLDWRQWLLASMGILLGAFTHIVWDGFTHENAAGVRMFPILDELGPDIAGHSVQIYTWLQFISSALGLIIVSVALLHWWLRLPKPAATPDRALHTAERWFWMALYLVPPASAIWHSVRWLDAHDLPPFTSAHGLVRLGIELMYGLGVSLVAVSALVQLRCAALSPARTAAT